MKSRGIEEASKMLAEFDFAGCRVAEAVTIQFFPPAFYALWYWSKYSIWLYGQTEVTSGGNVLPCNWNQKFWSEWIDDCAMLWKKHGGNGRRKIYIDYVWIRFQGRSRLHGKYVSCDVVWSVDEKCFEGIHVYDSDSDGEPCGNSEEYIDLHGIDIKGSEDVIDIVCKITDHERSDFIGVSY